MSEAIQYTIAGRSAREIAASVEDAVRLGRLQPGERLPAVRGLATTLGVSPTTVAAAYRDLARRGIILGRERRRAVVSPRPPVALPFSSPAGSRGLRDLSSGNPDPALLPDLAPILRSIDAEPALYGCEPALPALLEKARTEFSGLGVHVETEALCLTSGALDGVQRVLSAQLRAGDRVAVEDPGYTNAFDLLRALGLVTVPVAVDDAGMRPDALAAALERPVQAVLLTPRGQNPTGAALDGPRTAELQDVLRRAPDVLIVEDDHLGAVAGVPGHTTVAGRRRWAVVRSVAKSLGPDLRLAFLAGDAETVARAEGLLQLGPAWVSHLLQRVVLALLTDAGVDRLLERAAARYAERRGVLLEALAAHGIEANGRTGFNVWIPVPDEAAAMEGLRDAGYLATPGSRYRLASDPAVRVTVSTLVPNEAEAIADAVARSLAPSRRTRAA